MPGKYEPLTESYFYILLCLYRGPNHGYGIMRMTQELSGGDVRIGAGTMYGATGNMMSKGWIREVRPDHDGYERRRQYVLTDAGRKVVEDELARLEQLTAVARSVIHGEGEEA